MKEMTRKRFLQTLAAMGLAATGGALAASCGGGGDKVQNQPQSRPSPKPVASSGEGEASTETETAAADDRCTDDSALTESELAMKKSLKYTTHSTEPGKMCDNCKFWTPPPEGEYCGTCQLIKGPINPKGYCTSWFERGEA